MSLHIHFTLCFGRLLPGSLMSMDSLLNATAGLRQGNPENSSAACGGAHCGADRVVLCSRSCCCCCCCPASRHPLDECGAIPAPCSMCWNLRFLRTIMHCHLRSRSCCSTGCTEEALASLACKPSRNNVMFSTSSNGLTHHPATQTPTKTGKGMSELPHDHRISV